MRAVDAVLEAAHHQRLQIAGRRAFVLAHQPGQIHRRRAAIGARPHRLGRPVKPWAVDRLEDHAVDEPAGEVGGGGGVEARARGVGRGRVGHGAS